LRALTDIQAVSGPLKAGKNPLHAEGLGVRIARKDELFFKTQAVGNQEGLAARPQWQTTDL
jgi:hypothetical protein